MKEKAKSRKFLLLSGILAVFGFSATGALFYFISRKNITAAELKSEILFRQEQAEKLQFLVKAAAETEDKRSKLSSYFVSSADTAKFFDDIEALGRRSGASFAVTSAEWGKDPAIPLLSLSFASSGKFEDIYELLLLLENAPFESKLTKFSIKKSLSPESAGAKTESMWEGSFSLEILSVN